MGELYGPPGRLITGGAGMLTCLGFVAAQMGAMGALFHHFWGLSPAVGIGVACSIVVVYASVGGIRSVAATDVVQFAVLAVVLPWLTYRTVQQAGGLDATFTHAPVAHFALLTHENPLRHLFIFIVMAIPFVGPAYMQRLLMARDGKQARNSLLIATAVQVVLSVCIALIALAVVGTNPTLIPRLTLPYAMDTVLGIGLRGLGIAGLFAVTMSTSDSYLHMAAVSLVHDVVQPLRKTPFSDSKELKLTRGATATLGVGAMWLAIQFKSIVGLLLTSMNFWLPVVGMPLLVGIWGWRVGSRPFCWAAAAGAITVYMWQRWITPIIFIPPTLPALVVNLLVLMLASRRSQSRHPIF